MGVELLPLEPLFHRRWLKTASCPCIKHHNEELTERLLMFLGIHYLPCNLGVSTTSCTTPSTTKEKCSIKNIPKQQPKPQGKPHAPCGSSLPCSAISDSRRTAPSLQGTAEAHRHFSHGTLQRTHKPRFVSGQIHRNSEAWQ